MCAVILGAGTGSLVATGIFAKTRAASKVQRRVRTKPVGSGNPAIAAQNSVRVRPLGLGGGVGFPGKGHRGLHVFPPGDQLGVQLGRSAGVGRGKVVLFTRVVPEVVEFDLAGLEKL
jgi:hypothetical protein